MNGKEILRGAALAGGLLGMFGSGVDISTNPEIQKLRSERQAINQEYGVSLEVGRDGSGYVVEGNYSPEQEQEILRRWSEDIKKTENLPENAEGKKREEIDSGIFFLSYIDSIGVAGSWIIDEEKKEKGIC